MFVGRRVAVKYQQIKKKMVGIISQMDIYRDVHA